MQTAQAVRIFAIGTMFLSACGSAKPTDAPTQIPAPTATIFASPTSAPTATPRVEATPTATAPVPKPTLTPSSEIKNTITETIGLKEGEKVVWDGPDVTFVFDKAYNDAFDGVKVSPNFKDAATPDEYWRKTVGDYWTGLIKANGGDVTPDQVGAYLKEKGIKVPTTNLVKDADGKYTYDTATVTNPRIVVKAMDKGELGSQGFLIGYDASTGTGVRAGIEVKNGTLVLSIARGPATMTRIASRGFSMSSNLLSNTDLMLQTIRYVVKDGNKDVFLGATISNYEDVINKVVGNNPLIVLESTTVNGIGNPAALVFPDKK